MHPMAKRYEHGIPIHFVVDRLGMTKQSLLIASRDYITVGSGLSPIGDWGRENGLISAIITLK